MWCLCSYNACERRESTRGGKENRKAPTPLQANNNATTPIAHKASSQARRADTSVIGKASRSLFYSNSAFLYI